MARGRFPSDDERLRRTGGIRISFEVLHPDPERPEQAQVFSDPEKRGIWTGLLLKAGHAFAGRTDDRCTLSLGDLVWITGRRSQAGAELSLARVCTLMGYELKSISGRSWIVHCKNLSQNQRWTPQTPRSSADRSAEIPRSESESESSLRKTSEKKPPRARKPSPAAFAIAAFCEEYKTARGVNPPVLSKDKRELGEAFADLGEPRFRAAAREFLRLEDDWIRDRSYSPRAFLQSITKCVVRVQDAERLAKRAPAADLAADLAPNIASLFGGPARV